MPPVETPADHFERFHLPHTVHAYLRLVFRTLCAHHLIYKSSTTISTLHSPSAATIIMADRQPRRWTSAEDQVLREQVDAQQAQGVGRDWCQVAMALPGRTNKDCRKRWHNSVAEGLRKGQWSKSEDQLLTHGVHRYGSQWTKVATCVSTRSADQCAKRWQQSLDPRLDRSEWREDEDAALLAAVERLGRHWKDIQEQYLPHRSKNCVKNRYSVLARRNATQLMPYEDSLESSSSDPGTPLQTEIGLSLDYAPMQPMQPMQSTTQAAYAQSQYAYVSNDGFSSNWADFSDPHHSLATSYPGSFSASFTSTYPAVDQSHILPSNVPQWNYMQTNMGMQHSMQYSAAPVLQSESYTYPVQQQPPVSTAVPYATSMAHAANPYAAPAGPSRQYPHPGGYGQQRRDSAPFG